LVRVEKLDVPAMESAFPPVVVEAMAAEVEA
jgi:hypothetical protein